MIGITCLATLTTVASMSLGVCSVLADDAKTPAYISENAVVTASDGRVVDMGNNYGREYVSYDQPLGAEGYTIGRIDTCMNGSIVINNIKMSVSDESQIPEDIGSDYLFKVDWKKNSDGSIAATSITSYSEPKNLVIASDGRVVDTGNNYGCGYNDAGVADAAPAEENTVVQARDGRVVDTGNNYGRGYDDAGVTDAAPAEEKTVVQARDGRVVDTGNNYGRGYDNNI